jgi:peptidoglycan biosynthesis protein MviN/MurJ (putative lipid II flippase)
VNSQRIGLGFALVILATCTVAFLVMDGPRAAISPALSTVVCGVILYRLVKHPMPPSRWSKRRIIVSAAVLGPVTIAMVAVLAWVVVIVPDWPTRLLALVGIAVVPAIVLWGVRIARTEHQSALKSVQGAPDE